MRDSFIRNRFIVVLISTGLCGVFFAGGCAEREKPAPTAAPSAKAQPAEPVEFDIRKADLKPLATDTPPEAQMIQAETKPAISAKKEIPMPGWPEPTKQNRPWTRWWWLGSAVEAPSLTAALAAYEQAGIGGVEICPIYGVKGYEAQFKDFLSPEWMDVLGHTLREGERLGIGVDWTLGTGWPFGGPMVTPEIASSGVILKKYELQDGQLTEELPQEPLQYLLAVSEDGKRVDVTDYVRGRKLFWEAPAGTWTLYAVAVKNPVQKVKRPAPGGDGYVLDPYSVEAMDAYLAVFDKALAGYEGPMPRAYFHDSFEYYGATWTTDFFDEFQSRRGYDLRQYIETLFGEGSDDMIRRVLCDYHATINELHLAYIRRWTKWCHGHGGLSRNQAHGAPANLVDLYAAADIPETEIFRHIDDAQIPMLKLSSSAAHLKGTPLASSESFTWLKEHFQTALRDLKKATDFLFLTGVNHLFFHGIPYSPTEADWPGWQFYASVNFGPGGGLWNDLPAYNAYVTRCQSILQGGKPDNDILLYLPMYDFWQKPEPLHMAFTVHNQENWLYPSAFYRAAMTLWKKGYTYDTVTDDFLAKAVCRDGEVVINEGRYAVIVVPHCEFMQPETLETLLTLAEDGATVLFEKALPKDVPGLSSLMQGRLDLQRSLKKIIPNLQPIASGQGGELRAGEGRLVVSDLETLLRVAAVPREPAMDTGLRFERRSREDGYDYFFVNCSQAAFDGWLSLGKPAYSAVLMDPLFEDRIGSAAVRQSDNQTQVYVQLPPGRSMILRTFTDAAIDGPAWPYTETTGTPVPIEGMWSIAFIDGGPKLPQGYQMSELTSWTKREDAEAKRFFGTARYTIEFEVPDRPADRWLLDLGEVKESARVNLNGVPQGHLWAEPFQLHLEPGILKTGTNTLVVEVTNSAANRIRDLDQRGVNWKYFYDINVVNIEYKPFDASEWPLFESGLLGPVVLEPLTFLEVDDVRQENGK